MPIDEQTPATGAPPPAHVPPSSLRRVQPVELFDAWLFAETDATLALSAWWSAPSSEEADAYATYRAALDREAHAAGLLALRLGHA